MRWRSSGSEIVVRENAQRGAADIVILPAAHRPEKREEAGKSETERHRHKINQHVHRRAPPLPARKAFSVTSMDEPDIASAAIKGVTIPAMAIGTATAL